MQPTEDGTFNLLLTSDASYEDTGWKNAEFDGLVEQARSTPDEAERAALYTQAQELILRDKPYIIPFLRGCADRQPRRDGGMDGRAHLPVLLYRERMARPELTLCHLAT